MQDSNETRVPDLSSTCLASSQPTGRKKLITRDPDIRTVLLRELSRRFCDPEHDLILQEFGCKKARIDVAVVNGCLHGFEIKSDSDTLERLGGQIEQYSRIFDFVTLICGRKLILDAEAIVPKWWGIKIAVMADRDVTLQDVRPAKQNSKQNRAALARMLWKDEALRCLRQNGHRAATMRSSAEEIWNAAAKKLTVRVLATAVRDAIKARGGSGFEKQSVQDGDSYTIESTVLLDYYRENLAWLLSQQAPDRPD